MRIVSFTEARNGLKSVLDHVVNDADYTVITRRDSEDALQQPNGNCSFIKITCKRSSSDSIY